MKIKALSVYSKILSFFMVLLGFSSCDNGAAEYGTPYAKFIVKGKVVDKEDNAVSGLKVALGRAGDIGDGIKRTYYIDSINTDKNGAFKLSVEEFPTSQKFVIKYEDIDKEENGLFGTVTDTVQFADPSFTNGSNSWYAGETVEDLGAVILEPEKDEE
ncbi:hypothetical protein D0T84_12255 [Dysgonomonas sp. 521]|uniref:radical SAM-associated putative lipoprotein n=1 Tax=Dysgonomonas sp. 521 TaxID=2302932 RepID=UPI0013D8AB4B|nr:radical SAM-associated putative lipoprotein [Dysgonomonas sp. 521]NDV95680.1 hypothetical protein [Dysgonomonas sp. 521]